MNNNRSKLKITFNSPAILVFALACVAVQVLNVLTHGASNRLLFSTYRASLLNPLTWLRCVTHVLGHADWGHLLNNMMMLLILGPMLEEKYGPANIVFVMLATAIATAVVIMIFFPNVALLGASGIVFAMILLSSITSTDGHTIPLTFILVAVLYIGQQVYEGIFVADNISQLGHIVGGVVGTALGFVMRRNKMDRYQR
ncbi:MAG: rhomboid family intramembrane serine protease [Clostridia bacterium]|nr:rhomboid family intramembrane serine protease [Clostridia bacterium]